MVEEKIEEQMALEKLSKEYNCTIDECTFGVMCSKMPFFLDKSADNTPAYGMTLAKLIRFFRDCKKNNIKLSGIIENPSKGQKKGWNECIEVNDETISIQIEAFLEKLLNDHISFMKSIYPPFSEEVKKEYNVTDVYEKVEIKAPLMVYDNNEKTSIRINSNYVYPYSDEELEEIIKEDQKQHEIINRQDMIDAPYNARLGRFLLWFYDMFNAQGIWNNANKMKAYSFLYDWMVIKGITEPKGKGFSGTIGKEKYDVVKNCIKAYTTYLNKEK